MQVAYPQVIGLHDRRSPAIRESSSFLKSMTSGLELLPPSTGAKLALELLSNAANMKRYAALLQDLQAKLRDGRVPVVIADPKSNRDLIPLADLSRPQRRWLGQVALELFFTQLLAMETVLLDLRPARFGVDSSGDAVWHPRPIYVHWDPRFLSGLRDMYAGFFLKQDARLQSGLADLGLREDGNVLLSHLGEGNQRGVRFRASDLRSNLRAMAAHNAMNETANHRSFAALGLYLASLYELLEGLDLAFDVRSAFMRSHRGR